MPCFVDWGCVWHEPRFAAEQRRFDSLWLWPQVRSPDEPPSCGAATFRLLKINTLRRRSFGALALCVPEPRAEARGYQHAAAPQLDRSRDTRCARPVAMKALAGIGVPAERTALNTAERVGYVAVTLRRDERVVLQLRNSKLFQPLIRQDVWSKDCWSFFCHCSV